MIQKHVDLIAIALLLTAISFCSHAREAFALGLRSSHIALVRPHYQGSRWFVPALPRLSFARD